MSMIDISSALGDEDFSASEAGDDLVPPPVPPSRVLRFTTTNDDTTATLSNHDPSIPEAYHFEGTPNYGSGPRKAYLVDKFFALRKTDNTSMDVHLTKFRNIADLLEEVNVVLPDEIIECYALKNLPKDYEIGCCMLMENCVLPSFEEMKSVLLSEEITITMVSEEKAGEALAIQQDRARHLDRECDIKAFIDQMRNMEHRLDNKRRQQRSRGEVHSLEYNNEEFDAGEEKFVNLDDPNDVEAYTDELLDPLSISTLTALAVTLNIVEETPSKASKWHLDSNAIHHINVNQSMFTTLQQQQCSGITSASCHGHDDLGIGSVSVQLPNGHVQTVPQVQNLVYLTYACLGAQCLYINTLPNKIVESSSTELIDDDPSVASTFTQWLLHRQEHQRPYFQHMCMK
ncbi:hypothetical protein AXG93_638s1240 [Marchantia polymorpha subsp. ruderalis]|uniref:Uncharacterized protein n=1 Tax=Marchantia polymorpha subsp. ruderalis TaxID=1480154 RepID=A0A176W7L7_MARPO|nr:hypothetical protein AXG93_638s1240 [Marchantia polymorpha subsp. ruderalis]